RGGNDPVNVAHVERDAEGGGKGDAVALRVVGGDRDRRRDPVGAGPREGGPGAVAEPGEDAVAGRRFVELEGGRGAGGDARDLQRARAVVADGDLAGEGQLGCDLGDGDVSDVPDVAAARRDRVEGEGTDRAARTRELRAEAGDVGFDHELGRARIDVHADAIGEARE